jgi:hypothetical protein
MSTSVCVGCVGQMLCKARSKGKLRADLRYRSLVRPLLESFLLLSRYMDRGSEWGRKGADYSLGKLKVSAMGS